ncbi:hypothetical protein B0H10DRAFT_1799812, partial [Mycena sp. CBHHK59/15]
AHSFSYGHTKKYSVTTPCTNVPLFCTLCPPIPPRKSPAVVWKYSMYAHVKLAHPRYWDDLLSRPKDLPAQLALNIAISREEMMALGATFGISEAPLAQTLAPAPRRGQKRVLDDITNVEAGPTSRTRT